MGKGQHRCNGGDDAQGVDETGDSMDGDVFFSGFFLGWGLRSWSQAKLSAAATACTRQTKLSALVSPTAVAHTSTRALSWSMLLSHVCERNRERMQVSHEVDVARVSQLRLNRGPGGEHSLPMRSP